MCGRSSVTRARRRTRVATSIAASATSIGWHRHREATMAAFDLNDDSVVCIIGSGAGGGTLGNELAQKGAKVVILEAGDRYEIPDFINDEWASFMQLAWKDM